MNIEEIRDFCLHKPFTEESFPFDDKVLVFKVKGKIFALIDIEEKESINLKCNPEWAQELRERYDEIKGGYHMNKKHWNTVSITGNLSHDFIKKMITHSYDLIVEKLPKKDKF